MELLFDIEGVAAVRSLDFDELDGPGVNENGMETLGWCCGRLGVGGAGLGTGFEGGG